MTLDLPLTFLELGNATSRNIEISQGDDVWVSYRKDTIKETNLLKIRRRHPELVRVRTFPKADRGDERCGLGMARGNVFRWRSRRPFPCRADLHEVLAIPCCSHQTAT